LKPIAGFDRSPLHLGRGVLGLRVQILFSRGGRMFWGLDLLLMLLMLGCRAPAIRKENAGIRMLLTHNSGTFLADVSKVSRVGHTKTCHQRNPYD
jgi:hypothetical protein